MKILLMLPKFHEKTLSHPGNIKTFRPRRTMYIYTLPPFMDALLSEERQLMKWVGIFWVGILRGEFSRGSLMDENFPGGNFPGGSFPRTVLIYTDIPNFKNFLGNMLKKKTKNACCYRNNSFFSLSRFPFFRVLYF